MSNEAAGACSLAFHFCPDERVPGSLGIKDMFFPVFPASGVAGFGESRLRKSLGVFLASVLPPVKWE